MGDTNNNLQRVGVGNWKGGTELENVQILLRWPAHPVGWMKALFSRQWPNQLHTVVYYERVVVAYFPQNLVPSCVRVVARGFSIILIQSR